MPNTRVIRRLPKIALRVLLPIGALFWLLHRPNPKTVTEEDSNRRKARAEYFQRMLMDPVTGIVPPGIRLGELRHAATIPNKRLSKSAAMFFNWREMGPITLGGRTRAVAVDVTDANTLMAGSVSGGVWKSDNAGGTWRLTSDYLGVTSISQDQREGHTDTWYFSTGETVGSTSSEYSISPFYGNGIYKSVDGGETWRLLESTASDPTSDSSPFSHTFRIRVSPVTGTVFVTGNGFGIYRSTNEGASFEKVLGRTAPFYQDVAVNSEGVVLATLSTRQRDGSVDASHAGIFVSKDDGATWSEVETSALPPDHYRSVAAFAPSNPDHAYVWTEGADEHPFGFVRVSVSDLSVEDRTANLPNFQGRILQTQGAYNMAIGVKPDDDDFVLLGGVNMFRSRDGFATPQTDEEDVWISRHSASDLCVDHHEYVFDPSDPSKIWIGCDQGIYTTSDVNGRSLSFRNVNKGYNVSQYYAAAMSRDAGDDHILGGLQDWGNISFTAPTFSSLIAAGDGGYSYLATNHAFTSLQNGRVFRHTYQNGTPRSGGSEITANLGSAFFITPFAVDPVDDRIMFYPSFNILWRNANTSTSPLAPWESLDKLGLPEDQSISALSVSTEPAHVLYLGTWSPIQPPRVLRLANADTSRSEATDVSVPGLPEGAWTSSVAVNPRNADEVIVAYSNYNIDGLHHTTNGGVTWESIEGNLLGSESAPGPSIRSATILPVATGVVYLVGTSTGVYSTDDLRGSITAWEKEGAAEIGNAIVSQISSRASDGRVLVATHGRGAFVGDRNSNPVAIEDVDEQPESLLADFAAYPNPFADDLRIGFTLAYPSRVTLSLVDMLGRRIPTSDLVRDLRSGRHVMTVDASGLAGGSYGYRLTAKSTGLTTTQSGIVVHR